jgi:hypothetical protein
MDMINERCRKYQQKQLEEQIASNIKKQIEMDRKLAEKLHNDINRNFITINDHIIA